MKTISTLLSSLFIGTAVFAAAPRPSSTLSFKATDQSQLTVVVDGKRFQPNHNSVMITGVDAGYHDVKVYRQRAFYGTNDMRRAKMELVYSSSLMVQPRTAIEMTVDRFGNISTSSQRISRYPEGTFYGSDRYDFQKDGNWDGGRDNSYMRTISDRDLNQALSGIRGEWYEGNKMKIAQDAIAANYFTAAQVKILLQVFTLEENKLQLAKLAYGKTIDKSAFTMTINDVFAFNASREDLARFIRNSR